jgi:HSP90 family molecular chaperone
LGRRYIWSSGADRNFNVAEDEGENADLGRGTLIKIHLKEGEEVRFVTDVASR